MGSARDLILGHIRAALGRAAALALPPPPAQRLVWRDAADLDAEIDRLVVEIVRVGGVAQRFGTGHDLAGALSALVAAEGVRRATLWATADLAYLGIAEALRTLGVAIVPPTGDARQIAGCDLGITGADAALPGTGTLLLRSSPERPRLVSLLPRIHLAIVRPAALRHDLYEALAEVKDDGHFVLVTGPSRTADIELTLTIGVHGPQALHVWVVP